ncbi:hypothetical protein JCM6882_002889 [Rhodosporidiobolus microsporus]
MGLFGGKKKEKIPDVVDPSAANGAPYRHGGASSQYASSVHSAAPSYRTQQSGYVPPSQGGGGYAGQQSHYARPDQGQQQYGYGGPQGGGGGGGGYGAPPPQQQDGQPQRPPVEPAGGKAKGSWFGKRGQADDQQRNELLAGAPPPGQYHGGQHGGQGGYQPHMQDQQGGGYGGQQEQKFENEEDEEVEGIKQQMRFVKQESLASTRNAVRIAREAEETARATLDKLGEQSDRIANTERHLDLAKAHNDRAVDETKELEALNRSIFRPTFTFNKQAKRDREERRLLDRHNAEKAEREETRREQYESRQRIDQTYHRMDRDAENAAGAKARARARGAERGRYQFEATASDDEVEDEIDGNLDELSGLAGRLKMLGTTMGQEVDSQNQKLGKIGNKVDTLDNKVIQSTQRLNRVK